MTTDSIAAATGGDTDQAIGTGTIDGVTAGISSTIPAEHVPR